MNRLICVAVVMMTVVLNAFSQPTDSKDRMRTVNVRGEGVLAVAPDQLRLSVQINTQAQNASAAMRAASGKTNEILGLLKNFGIEDKNIHTTRVNVSPTYDYSKQIQPPPIVGYNATNDISILFKGKLMEKVGEFMDKAVTAGATNFGALQYEASRQRELERDALVKAAADARVRADVLAKELGAAVGQVFTITENVGSGGPVPLMMKSVAMDASSGAPVMSGEISIRAEVNVVFELK